MKRFLRRIWQRATGSSIRTRLIVSFSVPVIIAMCLAMIGIHKILIVKNEQQVLSRAMASYNQSYDLIESYIDTMFYVSDNIYYNGDLQRIVGSRDFADERDMDERYREFYLLDKVFTSAENASVIYRAGIFLRGDIPYTNNKLHIMSMESLFSRSDYMRYVYTVRRERMYYSPPVEITTPGVTEPTRAVTLLRPINATDGTAQQIGIAQVCVAVEDFTDVLSYAQTTEGAFVYLADEYRQLIASTDEDYYWTMKSRRELPLNNTDETWSKVQMDGREYYLLRRKVPEARWTLATMIPVEDVAAEGRYLTVIISVLTFVIIASIVSVAVLLSSSYTRRLKNLNGMIQKVRSGELKAARYRDSGNDEISELFRSFNEMTVELKNLMRAQYRSGKAVKSAELRALQAQINPHFLYNTLDLINWEAFEHDAPEISEIAQNLARFYRISLNKGRQIVTIREELEHVTAYVSIENKHFDNAIHLHKAVPEELLGLACINIILQPFVENAILHGFAPDSTRKACNIRIAAQQDGGVVVFSITDDGAGMTEEQIEQIFVKNTARKASGYGIKNIHSRIQLLFGEAYGVSYRKEDSALGTTAYITLPALTPEEAENQIENNS